MELKGKIVSNKLAKTVVVEVTRLKKHALYGKYMKISNRYKAHSEEPVEEGKTVVIESVRPLSKDKRWKIKEIL
ncbi:30S ribosomal protein S17 [Candidatus Giovannonibacteria bacterium]|nr:30S ribosomal protein S17 [Candidatus Giovannonibacteria bacterium]